MLRSDTAIRRQLKDELSPDAKNLGLRSTARAYAYNASKFAMEGLSESPRRELLLCKRCFQATSLRTVAAG